MAYYFATGYEADPALMSAITGRSEQYIQEQSFVAIAPHIVLRALNVRLNERSGPRALPSRNDINSRILRWAGASNDNGYSGGDFAESTRRIVSYVPTVLVGELSGPAAEGLVFPVEERDEDLLAQWREVGTVTSRQEIWAIRKKTLEDEQDVVKAFTFNFSDNWLTDGMKKRPSSPRRIDFTAKDYMIERAKKLHEKVVETKPQANLRLVDPDE